MQRGCFLLFTGAGGFPDDQTAIDRNIRAGAVIRIIHFLSQERAGHIANGIRRLVNGGEGLIQMLGSGNVIRADDRNVFRHP